MRAGALATKLRDGQIPERPSEKVIIPDALNHIHNIEPVGVTDLATVGAYMKRQGLIIVSERGEKRVTRDGLGHASLDEIRLLQM